MPAILQEGMPRRGDPFSKGDLYIQFKVDFPAEELEEDTRRLLRQALPASTGDAGADATARELAALDPEADDVEHVVMRQADANQMVRVHTDVCASVCVFVRLPIGLSAVYRHALQRSKCHDGVCWCHGGIGLSSLLLCHADACALPCCRLSPCSRRPLLLTTSAPATCHMREYTPGAKHFRE